MKNFEQNVLNKLDEIIDSLKGDNYVPSEEQIRNMGKGLGIIPLQLESQNFRISSDGWKKITKDGKRYLVNPEGDVWELLDGECKGEQLFTYDAAMRESKKAGKVIPTDEQLSELLKVKEDLKNTTFPGYRYTDGNYYNLGWYLYLWSSTPNGSSNAWLRHLSSSYSTVVRYNNTRANGFLVRCLRD